MRLVYPAQTAKSHSTSRLAAAHRYESPIPRRPKSNNIQNYTCSSSSSDETPKAIGALATLYDVTCTAANFPHMLTMITKIAYNMNLPTNFDNFLSSLPPANLAVLGHHYFQNSVPIFNLNTPTHQGGLAFTKLEDKLDSPSDAVQGGNGAVAWLALSTVEGTVGEYSSVYRVNTAGGAPPKTCQNMPSHFEVEYSANYYFFGK